MLAQDGLLGYIIGQAKKIEAGVVGQETDKELELYGFLPKGTAALSVPQEETGEAALLLCYDESNLWFYEIHNKDVDSRVIEASSLLALFDLWGAGGRVSVAKWLKKQETTMIEYMANLYANDKDGHYSRAPTGMLALMDLSPEDYVPDLELLAEEMLSGKSGQLLPNGRAKTLINK